MLEDLVGTMLVLGKIQGSDDLSWLLLYELGDNGLFSAEAVSCQQKPKVAHAYGNVGCRVVDFCRINDVSFEEGACIDRVNPEILKKCSNVVNIVLDRGSCKAPTTLGRQGTDSTKLFCIFIPNFVR